MIDDPRISTPTPLSNTTADIPVKLLYSKSKVYVHPSGNASDFIPGYLSIIEKVNNCSSLQKNLGSSIPFFNC